MQNRWALTVGMFLGVWLLGLARPALAQSAPAELEIYQSRHYAIHTDLTRVEARTFGTHMDGVFDEYVQRFQRAGLRDRQRNHAPMPLYLFRHREDYVAYLGGRGVPAQNSGGMFFVMGDFRGLATFIHGRPISDTFAVLQHEGFHQFAFRFIGPDLPIWVNEGLAQYFEDGIVIGRRLSFDHASARRLRSIQAAIEGGYTIEFRTMLSISLEEWHAALQGDPERASLLYDQAWSMAHFLIQGDGGRYREAFQEYLTLVAEGQGSSMAFARAFGTSDPGEFERAWARGVSQMTPDPLSVARNRMSFLAQGLLYLHEQDAPTPRNIVQLKEMLQRVRFRSVMLDSHTSHEMSALDDDVFEYDAPDRARRFRLIEASGDTPPGLLAANLRPQVTLVWDRDAEGNLVMGFRYR